MSGRDRARRHEQQRPPRREDATRRHEALADISTRTEGHHADVADPHLVGEDFADPVGEAAATAQFEPQAPRLQNLLHVRSHRIFPRDELLFGQRRHVRAGCVTKRAGREYESRHMRGVGFGDRERQRKASVHRFQSAGLHMQRNRRHAHDVFSSRLTLTPGATRR